VPAAAVIPSLRVFSYVVAVKRFIAFISRKTYYFEEMDVFITEKSLYSAAKNDMP